MGWHKLLGQHGCVLEPLTELRKELNNKSKKKKKRRRKKVASKQNDAYILLTQKAMAMSINITPLIKFLC